MLSLLIASQTINGQTVVNTISELRNSTQGESYTLSGEAILTFQQNFRNQKFIEDETAAILIDDPESIITTNYTQGDGITGITGILSSFSGMIQFRPSIDPGEASSTGNVLEPQLISIDELNTNPEQYESEFVQIQEAVTIDTSNSADWIVGTIYQLTAEDSSFNFRTSFFDVDYINSPVPTEETLVSGIITERQDLGGYFITSLNSENIETALGINDINLVKFSIYPNPTVDVLNIGSNLNNEVLNIKIINNRGRTVIKQTSSGPIDVTVLSNGNYFIQIEVGNIREVIQFIKK